MKMNKVLIGFAVLVIGAQLNAMKSDVVPTTHMERLDQAMGQARLHRAKLYAELNQAKLDKLDQTKLDRLEQAILDQAMGQARLVLAKLYAELNQAKLDKLDQAELDRLEQAILDQDKLHKKLAQAELDKLNKAKLAQAKLDPELFDAVGAGDQGAVEESLKKGADINAQQGDGKETPLMIAVGKEDLDMVKFLVNQKNYLIGLEFRNKDGLTALLLAVENGNVAIVDFLYSKEAVIDNPYVKNVDRAVVIAIRAGHEKMVAYLISLEDPQKTVRTVIFYPRDVLGVSKDASQGEIKKAYERRLEQWKPDKAESLGLSKKSSERLLQRLQQAYDSLKK